MKKHIAKFLTLSLVLTSALVFSPVPGQADVVSAATGETTTSTPAKTTTTTPAVTVAGDVYAVVSGDAFWKIAKKFNLTIDELAKLNPQVKNINKLAVGQKLTVKAAATPATPATPAAPAAAAAKKLFHGLGEVANYRDRNGNPNDQLNFTTASAIFDEDGKIVQLTWDVMEVTAAMFPSWLEAKLDKAKVAEYQKTVDGVWETKREEGYNYDMTHKKSKGAADNLTKKEWFEQLDFYQGFFKGKTVAEVEAWFKKYTDSVGKPYKMAYPEKLTEADKKVTDTFTADEKKMLVDVTTSATMSLQDGHSFFISALKEAYEKRLEIK
jgi:LysM repeat protein